MTRLLRNPFCWLFLFLLAFELGARRFVPYLDAPRAGAVSRNAYRMRGWPEYVPGTNGDGRLVILIGNSQGYAREIPAESIYAHRLQERFRTQGLPVRIENWSLPGATMVDHQVALLAALERAPDVLLLMRTFEDCVLHPALRNLDYTGMDIDLLAGSPRMWGALRRSALKLDMRFGDFAKRFLMRTFALARSRIHALDIVSLRMADKRLFRLFFGHEREIETFSSFMPEGGFPHLVDKLRAGGEGVIRRGDIDKKLLGLPFFLEGLPLYIADLQLGLARRDTRVVWCWNPHAPGLIVSRQRRRMDAAYARADALLAEAGIQALDLRDAVPKECYFTYSHFDEQGHGLVADLLEPLILDALQ